MTTPPADFRIDRLSARELRIPFKATFTHASASRSETSSLWVEAICAGAVVGQGESCPRPYVTNETVHSALAFVATHGDDVCRHVTSVGDLRSWLSDRRYDIDQHPAAWCAIELALLDAFGKHVGQPVESLLGLPPLAGEFRYTAVVGDDDPEAFQALVRRYTHLGFRDFKVKLSGDLDRDRRKLSAFAAVRGEARVRADANNVWSSLDQAVAFLQNLAFEFAAIEEPLPIGRYADLADLANTLDCAIILDESLTRSSQLADLPGPSSRWIANVRVSKMGGLLRSLEVIEAARVRESGVIVGAQVGETSLLTRAGLTAAHAARGALIAHEGAYGTHLLAEDVCEPPLMFGAGGLLDVATMDAMAPGLGRFTTLPSE